MKQQPMNSNPRIDGQPQLHTVALRAQRRAHVSPSTRETLIGLLSALFVGGLASTSASAEPGQVTDSCARSEPDDRPMMHAAFYQDYASSDAPTVIISDIETWTEFRKKTDRTYVDEKGETQPLYVLLEPSAGHVYLRVVADVSTAAPRSYATDQLLIVSGPDDGERWESAPLATFDAQGLPQVGAVTEPAEKVELDLLYEVPAGAWHDYYIEIGNRSYGPLDRYLDPIPVNEDAADAGPSMDRIPFDELSMR
ncbi:MAG: hypothetical protein R3E97_06180 [Candidatus Eisenbacteria bacterium]